MKKHSKRYRESTKKLGDKDRVDLPEAVKTLKHFSNAKFDETVEIAFKLGIDPRKSDQMVRGSFVLPHGIGKERRIIVFAEGDKAAEAAKAGAIEVGSADLAKKIQDGWNDFDVAIAEPAMMKHVGKLGKILGPQGKMPSPKSGTVTDKIKHAVSQFRAGKIEFRSDAGGNVHAVVGKKSFDQKALVENIESLVEYIRASKPPAAKGIFLQKVTLSSTMSPGIHIKV
jgi:large subunit ribosomal protein L1